MELRVATLFRDLARRRGEAPAISCGGRTLSYAELDEHPDVADVAVIGVPDEKWGEAVKVIIVAREGVRPTEPDVIDYTRGKLAGYKRPRSVDVVESIPRNPSGKVLKRELRAPYWAGRERSVG